MREKSTETVGTSSPTWETLEAFARQSMQQLLQRLLEEEVDGLLGRGRYERREAVDPAVGYRNGFGGDRGALQGLKPRARSPVLPNERSLATLGRLEAGSERFVPSDLRALRPARMVPGYGTPGVDGGPAAWRPERAPASRPGQPAGRDVDCWLLR